MIFLEFPYLKTSKKFTRYLYRWPLHWSKPKSTFLRKAGTKSREFLLVELSCVRNERIWKKGFNVVIAARPPQKKYLNENQIFLAWIRPHVLWVKKGNRNCVQNHLLAAKNYLSDEGALVSVDGQVESCYFVMELFYLILFLASFLSSSLHIIRLGPVRTYQLLYD